MAIGFPGCEADAHRDLDALVAFAREPSDATWASVPFADRVQLGLGDRLVKPLPARALRDPAAWTLEVDGFRAGVGPFSPLEVLADERPLEYGEASYRRCVSPPGRPPRAVSRLRRLNIQPRDVASCLQWFAVDVYVDERGEIRAVTLDLWEP